MPRFHKHCLWWPLAALEAMDDLEQLWPAFIAGIVLVMHGIGVLLAADVLLHGRTAPGTIAWLLGLVIAPYVAIPLYLLVGWRRFDGYTDARRSGDQPIQALGSRLMQQPELSRLAWQGDGHLWRGCRGLARMPGATGNDLQLLIDGEVTLASLLAGIGRARAYVLVQFYIVRDDSTGRALADALLERAATGCRCWFLYDEIGSYQLPRRYLDRLRNGGVAVSAFNSSRAPNWLQRFRINFRNHRKVVVIDGREAWVGGHNMGDEYLGRDQAIGRWRDTHVHIRGPATLAAQLSWLEDWNWATGSFPDLAWPAEAPPEADMPAMLIPTGPADSLESGTVLMVHLIGCARQRCWIVSPYFVPDESVISSLIAAAVAGVDVRIMLPANPDARLPWLAAHSLLPRLLAHGVQVHAWTDGFLHQKVVLIDDLCAGVGTMNLDNRSLRINFELTCLSPAPAFIAAVTDMLEADLAQCERWSAAHLTRRSWWFRLQARMAHLFAPLL